jgi:hypothetical protein
MANQPRPKALRTEGEGTALPTSAPVERIASSRKELHRASFQGQHGQTNILHTILSQTKCLQTKTGLSQTKTASTLARHGNPNTQQSPSNAMLEPVGTAGPRASGLVRQFRFHQRTLRSSNALSCTASNMLRTVSVPPLAQHTVGAHKGMHLLPRCDRQASLKRWPGGKRKQGEEKQHNSSRTSRRHVSAYDNIINP